MNPLLSITIYITQYCTLACFLQNSRTSSWSSFILSKSLKEFWKEASQLFLENPPNFWQALLYCGDPSWILSWEVQAFTITYTAFQTQHSLFQTKLGTHQTFLSNQQSHLHAQSYFQVKCCHFICFRQIKMRNFFRIFT